MFRRSGNITILSCFFITAVLATYGFPRKGSGSRRDYTFIHIDSLDSVQQSNQDSLYQGPYQPSKKPTYQPKDRYGDPITNNLSPSPLLLQDPSSLKMDVEIDTGNNYIIYEKIGDINYRPTSTLTFDEFNRLQDQKLRKDYWKTRSAGLDGESAVSGRDLIPKIYLSPVFDRIFGGSFIDIQRNGFATLDFGAGWQRTQNPAIPIRQQRIGGFEFDLAISMNVVGKIGEKLAISANFDNNNSFDFQNDLKIEYTGYEEDIIKKLEIGNVSLPLNNSLISGAQNLFGVKTQMQFGKLFVTSVASSQRGTSETVRINQGFQGGNQYELQISEYDENRHFFLGHYFRDNYEDWITPTQQIRSGVNINRIEVYVINRTSDTETIRNFVAFQDLGETNRIYRSPQNFPDLAGTYSYINQGVQIGNIPTDNQANGLFNEIRGNQNVLFADSVAQLLQNEPFLLARGLDFEATRSARLLNQDEYAFNPQLGYISLNRPLQNDESLAVAYEYTSNGGNISQVGELTQDYQNRPEDQVIILKLLRPGQPNPRDQAGRVVPTWDLMMKNIYNLGVTRIEPSGFELRVIYRDDRTGQDIENLQQGQNTANVPLIEIMDADQLNPNGDQQPDRNYDYVEGVTINPQNGRLIFPVVEPFGNTLRNAFTENEASLINQFVYDSLYRATKIDAEQDATRNKYYLVGNFQSGSPSEITLPGINVAEGSVRVLSGQTPLVEGVQYTVDYNFGRVRIIDESVLNSGKELAITYEKADLFNFRNRTLLGSRFDYIFNDDISIGATILRLNEQPLISRVNVGNEPVRNVKYGFDVNYKKDSRLLTKIIDKIPGISTKEISTVAFNGEFAQLIPGTSNQVDGQGTSYIDDFETTITPFSLISGNAQNSWNLSSTPLTDDFRFDLSRGMTNDLSYGFRRAKLAWYVIANTFYQDRGRFRPSSITDDVIMNNYVAPIPFNEIFRNRDEQAINTPELVFNLAYYPEDRGPYNYNPDFNVQSPEDNFGGITRAITTNVNFNETNIEFIEFWMLDPFITGENGRDGAFGISAADASNDGGKLVFNLGSISEDIARDERHGFENGLPADGDASRAFETNFGVVTTQQYFNDAFSDSGNERANQDVGFDGIPSSEEFTFFNDRIQDLLGRSLDQNEFGEDASSDDFRFFLDPSFDDENAGILERYKDINGHDGNTPPETGDAGISQRGSQNSDNEDLNNDNTLGSLEEYYEYEIDLDRNNLQIGRNNIVDQVTSVDGERNWYLFRIPIRNPDRVQGNITGFNSIRYIRMYMTQFSQPVVARMVNLRIVGSQWRRFTEDISGEEFSENTDNSSTEFEISVVNIEENGFPSPGKVPYVLPPGIERDRDNSSTVERRRNEQSLRLCVNNLNDNDARAVFKTVNTNLINYGRLRMFLHAENGDPINPQNIPDGAVTAFIRLGNDYTENYYEVEVPLTLTPTNTTETFPDPRVVWPLENEIDIDFESLFTLKIRRDREEVNKSFRFGGEQNGGLVGNQNIFVVGNPQLDDVRAMMIGIRNPKGGVLQSPVDLCIWANELRVTDFDDTKGWAANGRLNMKLADFATFNATGRITTDGFGSIQDRISDRVRAETRAYDISTNIALDKFLPEKTGLKIPFFASYEQSTVTPQFDPLNPDITLSASVRGFDSPGEGEAFKQSVITKRQRKSYNFSNVRKVKTKEGAKKRIYDIENFAFTYAYSEENSSDANTESFINKDYRGAVDYNFRVDPISIEPFKNSERLSSPYLKLIKDFNFSPLPNSYGFRWDVNRSFRRRQLYNDERTTVGVDPYFEKSFTFNRAYNLGWQLTKSINIDYDARANAVIDEPEGDIDTEVERDSIWDNLLNFGRLKNFNQNISANYRLPLDKIPLVDWVSADFRYGAGYIWQAGALEDTSETDDSEVLVKPFGNTIRNSRDRTISGKVDLVKLYNKVPFLKKINDQRRSRSGRSRPTRRPSRDSTEVPQPDLKFVKGFLRAVMSLRSINVNYSIRESTFLPGFTPEAFLFGLDSGLSAPGVEFLLGSQDRGILERSARNGWLTTNEELTTPFQQSRTRDLTIRADIEPFRDLKVQLTARKQTSSDFQEIFRFDSESGDFQSFTPSRGGTYSISYSIIRTAFNSDNSESSSETFEIFEENRRIIADRLNAQPGSENVFNVNSTDVLIPAFISAYSGRSVDDIELTAFQRIPIPNWRIDYTGLSRIKGLNDIFSSITINHAYSSTLNLGNFNSNLPYNDADFIDLSNDFSDFRAGDQLNIVGDGLDTTALSVFNFSQITLREQFAPFIGINVTTKSRLRARAEYRRERNLTLTLTNSIVTEARRNDVSLEIGYTKANFRIPFRIQGRTVRLKNDLTFDARLTISDNRTLQRRVDSEEDDIITQGNLNFQLRPQISYLVNSKLNVQFYFERTINEPRVTTSFRRTTSAFGFQVRFSLAE
ncbi:MAG: cell surface protein SprA [Bacteroidota bacterium]